jgi:ABC-type lipoprotein export system ATPase subunit
MLFAKNIHKRYGAVEVLKGVDISIAAGEIVSIVGPSGSGKSTLLHILGTLDLADQGEVEIEGVRIESKPEYGARPAPWWKRALNMLVDYALVSLASGYIFQWMAVSLPLPEAYHGIIYQTLFTLLMAFIYFTLAEGLSGRSLAKLLTATKVMSTADYSKPTFRACLYRSLARLIPFEFISFLSNRPVGWHDAFASTMVTSASYAYRRRSGLTAEQLAQFRNRKIGFVFQFHHLLPEFTALENVCIAGWINSNKKEVKERAIRILTVLGLKDRLHNKPSQLSGGEQQRVAVARALINQPAIVFADEPTGNLDTINARELHQLFFDLRKEFNQTFLIVTHNEELAKLSDRMLTMKDGRMS